MRDEEHLLWTGAVRGAVWAEGPHLYRKDGTYYLLAAEGGTDFHHAISVARSDSVTGPYEGNKANPILTHRNLGRAHDVVGVGHADLVQAPDGSWWSVMLAMRTYGGYHYNLGRETWLAPVTWEDGWPVFAPGTARLADTVDLPWASAGEPLGECQGATSGVVAPTSLRWTALRGPGDSFAAPSGEGWNLTARPQTIAEPTIPAFLGVRQQHKSLDVSTSLDASVLRPGEEAGLVVLQGEFDSLRIVVRDGAVEARMRVKGEERTLASTEVCACGSISLRLAIRGQEYALQYQDRQGDWATLTVADGSEIDTASAGGFTGLWLGIYASSNGAPTGTRVEFGPLNYEPRD
jgi:alpha-N-arabinofuranosidase